MATDSFDAAIDPVNSQPGSAWPTDIAKFIETEIADGQYASELELICDAVRQLHERKTQSLKREIQIGIDDAECGRVTNLEDDAGLKNHMNRIWQRVQDRAARSTGNLT